jgi:hypothetical protein
MRDDAKKHARSLGSPLVKPWTQVMPMRDGPRGPLRVGRTGVCAASRRQHGRAAEISGRSLRKGRILSAARQAGVSHDIVRSLTDGLEGNDRGFWRLIEQRSRKRKNLSVGKAYFFGNPEERVWQDWRHLSPYREAAGRHGAAPGEPRSTDTKPAATR